MPFKISQEYKQALMHEGVRLPHKLMRIESLQLNSTHLIDIGESELKIRDFLEINCKPYEWKINGKNKFGTKFEILCGIHSILR